jgi:hypothetical protein
MFLCCLCNWPYDCCASTLIIKKSIIIIIIIITAARIDHPVYLLRYDFYDQIIWIFLPAGAESFILTAASRLVQNGSPTLLTNVYWQMFPGDKATMA